MTMGPVGEPACGALDNHLGWQGWQLDLPRQWNPARLTGSARTGTVSVVDLEQPRLELRWRRVRSTRGIDLMRATPIGGGPAAAWRVDQRRREGIAALRWGAADNGDTLGLALSEASSRLAFLRITGGPDRPADEMVDRILASFSDTSGRAEQPWCVYGFAWMVPIGFRLMGHHFAAGRAVVSFRRGRQSLSLERWVSRPSDAVASSAEHRRQDDDERPMEVRGHRVRVRRVIERGLWRRITGRQTWQAEWACQSAGRDHRVTAEGPQALDLLGGAAKGVNCHGPAGG